MIDLHCHILPGIDDGASTLAVALAMARMAVADGIMAVACTPHVLPGVYNNSGIEIQAAIARFAEILEGERIPLMLTAGADAHMDIDLLAQLKDGRIPTLNGSRYFLLEPPHHIAPPRLGEFAFGLITAGYTPILTHPERFSWTEGQYHLIQRMAASGVLMQITAGSFTGGFGRRALYWAERMLDEDLIDLIATDAHDVVRRPPKLSPARDRVAALKGDEVAIRLVANTPLHILQNVLP